MHFILFSFLIGKVIQQLEFPTTLERINNLNIVLIGVFRFKIFIVLPQQDPFGKQIFGFEIFCL